jgi:hypothetical protein
MTAQEKGDCLNEVTAWAGSKLITKYIKIKTTYIEKSDVNKYSINKCTIS